MIMITGYTSNISVQILISLLRKYGIKRAIISPGTTNLEFVAGLQYNGEFELYSAVDERSAAYMACGMAASTKEPVIITCTEATASRNYYPGLTEAYYRKLPILAVTGVHRYAEIGHLQPQIIDRSVSAKDALVMKVQLPIIKDKEDIWQTEIEVNKAIHALKRRGGGPVHIDLPCCNNDYQFDTTQLTDARIISYYDCMDELPKIPNGKVAVFIGSHNEFSIEETAVIDSFCGKYDSVVFCDHTSGYHGKYMVHAGLVAFQRANFEIFNDITLLIHLGEASGDGSILSRFKSVKEVWRVNSDGELRDTFKKLSSVFEMREVDFFSKYVNHDMQDIKKFSYLDKCNEIIDRVSINENELPFSNVYVAAKIAPNLPSNSYIHIGVSNTIRAWTLFEFPDSIKSSSNVGCRGIDGIMSAFVGATLVRDELCFCVLGDLTFFYDLNSLGNRSIGNNVRILLINNNSGGVMKLQGAPGYRFFGDAETDKYIAAAGHFGNKSKNLVRHFAEDLGFEYLSAENKEEFEKVYLEFVSSQIKERPIIFEVFTDAADDREAFNIASSVEVSSSDMVKELAKKLLGNTGTAKAKRILSGRK